MKIISLAPEVLWDDWLQQGEGMKVKKGDEVVVIAGKDRGVRARSLPLTRSATGSSSKASIG